MKPQLQTEHAEVLKTLGHPTRIEIICLLDTKKKQTLSVKQIQEKLKLTQVEASQHLLVLRKAGILLNQKIGTSSLYAINYKDDFIKEITHCLNKNI